MLRLYVYAKINIMNEIYNWIISIINTSTNDFHFEGVDNLIELFFKKFNDDGLYIDLQFKRSQKWNEIHSILK